MNHLSRFCKNWCKNWSALLFNTSDKYAMGAIYDLDEGFLMIIISGIVSEELENEAVLTLCSLTTEE